MTDPGLVDFCRTQYPRLVGFLGLYCGDRGVAEELAQETLARVWRRWPKVHDLDRPDAWAHRVATNLANSHLRRLLAERKARARLSPPPAAAELPPVDLVVTVRRAISQLPRRQREAILLHFYLDLPLAQIAESMGTSVGGVKSLLHRATGRLRTGGYVTDPKEVVDVT
jgi:RNA polymerase sigma-70 factor (sigma-E family)